MSYAGAGWSSGCCADYELADRIRGERDHQRWIMRRFDRYERKYLSGSV